MQKKIKNKNFDFLYSAENCEKFICFSVRKDFEKENNKVKTFNKAYSARFVDSIKFMNAS